MLNIQNKNVQVHEDAHTKDIPVSFFWQYPKSTISMDVL